MREVARRAAEAGLRDEEIAADHQGFRAAWRATLDRAIPSLADALWPRSDASSPLQLAPWDDLLARVRAALPEADPRQAEAHLENLLDYGRGAGVFVDRHHVFLVPPSGVYCNPEDRRLWATPHPDIAAGLPLPEVGICECGQPYLALVRGRHDGWLTRPPLSDWLGPNHCLRKAWAKRNQPGIYWPVGHRVRPGHDPYADATRVRIRGGVARQRCAACGTMLGLAMLRDEGGRGAGRRAGGPRSTRVRIENFLDYLLTVAVEQSADRRVLAISDGRNLAGRIARDFLRDDTLRLGVAGLFVDHLLRAGPTPARALHDTVRGTSGPTSGVLWQRLVTDIYGQDYLGLASPIYQAIRELHRHAFLDRFRRLLFDDALIVPEIIQADPDRDPFDIVAAWWLFAAMSVRRPNLPIAALDVGGDDLENIGDDDDLPLWDDEPTTGLGPGPRIVTEALLRMRFVAQWAERAGRPDDALREVFGRAFRLLREEGFFEPLPGSALRGQLLDAGLNEEQRRRWLDHHGLNEGAGDSGAFTYAPSLGGWRAAVSRSRTYCRRCGVAWPGRFAACWNCTNRNAVDLPHHDPTDQPAAAPEDRLGTFLGPHLEAWRAGRPAPLRTVEALRAGLPPVDRSRVEEAFRKGRLNVLSATTLMELGVDIGRLDTLVQHGVPPTFTNYVQRSGRVGRGRGRSACVLNVLRPDHPIDMYFFADLEGRFFRDLAPIRVPASADARVVAAAHALGYLLSCLATQDGEHYAAHWRSPQEGTRVALQQAVAYFVAQVGARRGELEQMLATFGLDAAQAAALLAELLDLGLTNWAEARPGSHADRVRRFADGAAPAGPTDLNAHAMAAAIREQPNYPVLLSNAGILGLYRSGGEPHAVRLRLPGNLFVVEQRSADQLLRECFPGPKPGEDGGFFYRGTTMFRIREMTGLETAASRDLPYCGDPNCAFRGMVFAGASRCPGCDGPLTVIRTAEPSDCQAEPLTGFLAGDPRVFAYVQMVVAPGRAPVAWEACPPFGESARFAQAETIHAVPLFYEGQSGRTLPSRILVPNDVTGREFCAAITETVPATALRMARARFQEDESGLAPETVWSAFAAFRQAVVVLLRRDPGDFHAAWEADAQTVTFLVADTHSGGTGLARQWGDLLANPDGRHELGRYLGELADCPRCARSCHHCLLHDRIAPMVVPLLDRRRVRRSFGLGAAPAPAASQAPSESEAARCSTATS